MITDIDDILYPVLKRTLVLWLIPYIFWYFSKLLFRAVWDWVTEPEEESF